MPRPDSKTHFLAISTMEAHNNDAEVSCKQRRTRRLMSRTRRLDAVQAVKDKWAQGGEFFGKLSSGLMDSFADDPKKVAEAFEIVGNTIPEVTSKLITLASH